MRPVAGLRARTSDARRHLRDTKRALRPAITAALCALAAVPLLVAAFASARRTHSVPDLAPMSRAALPGDVLRTASRAAGFKEGYCHQLPGPPGGPAPRPENFLGSANRAWLVLLLPGVVFLFIGLAIVTDDYFVPALERICEQLNLSEDVAGATFMAAGSSAPELFTSLLAVFVTKDDVGIGTIVGSAVFNILVIIGLSAALAGATLDLDFRPLLRDSFFYICSVALLLLFVLGITRGQADWYEGLILMFGYVVYILFMKFGNKPYFAFTKRWVKADPAEEEPEEAMENGHIPPASPLSTPDATAAAAAASAAAPAGAAAAPAGPGDAEAGGEDQPRLGYSNLNPRSQFKSAVIVVMAMNRMNSGRLSEPKRSLLGIELPGSVLGWVTFPMTFPWALFYHWTIVDCSKDARRRYWPATFAASIVWISGISFAMVEGARLAGCFIGIPSAVMGLTFLAAGTSVPDALASVAVARNGQGNMAVSNAIGSNVFDILLGLGLPWFLAALILRSPQKVTVTPITTVVVPIVVLLAIIISLIALLVAMHWKLSKTLGYILFGMYGLFFAYSLIEAFVIKM